MTSTCCLLMTVAIARSQQGCLTIGGATHHSARAHARQCLQGHRLAIHACSPDQGQQTVRFGDQAEKRHAFLQIQRGEALPAIGAQRHFAGQAAQHQLAIRKEGASRDPR
ncbi:hypothetical protein D3C85_1593440 [compost metagenome]